MRSEKNSEINMKMLLKDFLHTFSLIVLNEIKENIVHWQQQSEGTLSPPLSTESINLPYF